MEYFKNKSVCLVGGAGLIGSHIVDLLADTDVNNVVIFDNFCRGKQQNLDKIVNDSRFNIVVGNIEDYKVVFRAIQGCHVVYILAALWLNHCQELPIDGVNVNLVGTSNVLEACVNNSVAKIVFSSSASVYGEASKDPMTEDHPFNNTTVYGATKIGGEALLKAYSNKYSIPSVALRYFNVYGPRQDYKGAYIAVMMRMIDNILNNKSPVVFGEGSQAFDFISVKDIARANLLAGIYDGEMYNEFNVCTGISTSIKTIAEMLIDIMESDVEIEYKPGDFPVSSRRGGIEKAANFLGFEATIDLKNGLRELVEWRKSF